MPGVTAAAGLRTVVLLGAPGVGKTALAAALTGGEPTTGSPTTHLDVLNLDAGGVRLSVVDTPGHYDLAGTAAAGVRAADAALVVVSAVGGVPPKTVEWWQSLEEAEMPRAIVVTHLDDPAADFDETVALCERLLGAGIVARHLPLFAGDKHRPGPPVGVIDVQTGLLRSYGDSDVSARPADPEHVALVGDARDELLEELGSGSDDESLLDRYLDGDVVSAAEWESAYESAVARGATHPVVPAMPTTGLGTAEVLDLVFRAFPAPRHRALPSVQTADGRPAMPLTADPAGPLVAQVVGRTVGERSIVRVFSGTLRGGALVIAGGRPATVPETAGVAEAGSLALLEDFGDVAVGATIANEAVTLPLWRVPEPTYPVRLDRAPADAEVVQLLADDPGLRAEADADTAELLLWCAGPRHAHVTLETSLLGDINHASAAVPQRPDASAVVDATVTVPSALVGLVVRHLPTRGGTRSTSTEDDSLRTTISIEIPEAQWPAYVTEIRELTDGTAELHRGRRVWREIS